MLEDEKIVIEDFGGLYSRGMDDTIPPGHFKVCHNAAFNERQIASRFGTKRSFTFSFRPTKLFLGVIGGTRFFLILDDQGLIHRDAGPAIGVVVHLAGTQTDFSALNLYNRIYLSPNLGDYIGTGFYNNLLQVYTGTGNVRNAGGIAPATSFTSLTDGIAGVVTAGVHKFAVSFVTDTGFITPPSPLASYTAPGSKKVDLTGIPLGPAECVGRRILCTKANELELFFVPGTGIINDNTSTIVTLDFADTDLVASADYLNDIYDVIPAGMQLVNYKGRLIIVGGAGTVLVSNVRDPETFHKVTGFLAIPTEVSVLNPPVSGWVLRDTLYISKFPGVYAVQDSGDLSPNNWPVSVVDESIGCYPNGIGSYTSEYSGRSTSDHDIILTQQGICLFDGVFRRPAMTWKIEDFWSKVVQEDTNNILGINFNFWRFTLTHDVVLKKFYVNCATATYNPLYGWWVVLHGDYSKGWEFNNIKWSIWEFPFYASAVVMALHPIDNKYALRITSFNDNKLWTLDDAMATDDGTSTILVLATGLLDKEKGALHFFLGAQLRASGNCTLVLALTDGISTTVVSAIPNMTINNPASKDYLRLFNFTSEKAILMLTTNGQLKISRIEVKCKSMFLQRPQL